jgi:excisionase family DNA binding protein
MTVSSPTSPIEHLCCTINQACVALAVSRTTVYQLIRERKIEARKIGGATRISVASIKEYHDSQPTGPEVLKPRKKVGLAELEDSL